jgi:hypothetical protein
MFFGVTVPMTGIVMVTVMVTVVGSGGEELFRLVVDHVGEDSVLQVSAQETLLGGGDRVLHSVVSPAVHPT